MNTEIKIYYIPKNSNNIKGQIYTMYINNLTNLDLFPIINIENNPNTRLLELNNSSSQLLNKFSKDTQKLITEQENTLTKLNQINIESQKLIKEGKIKNE